MSEDEPAVTAWPAWTTWAPRIGLWAFLVAAGWQWGHKDVGDLEGKARSNELIAEVYRGERDSLAKEVSELQKLADLANEVIEDCKKYTAPLPEL